MTTPTMQPLHVVFCHLDLGIGGAEQLFLQLATASQSSGHRLNIVTTRCDPDHCFASVKPGGLLHPHLHVWGRWIPMQIAGRFRAACSSLRLFYLAWQIARRYGQADVIVVDVLPLPLPLWQWTTDAALLFYCHFPDKLLIQHAQTPISLRKRTSPLTVGYRSVLDSLEEWAIRYADEIAVNSQFTRQVVLQTFPSCQPRCAGKGPSLPVLYPALDTSSIRDNPAKRGWSTQPPLLVSLNRYERKKKLELVIHAVAWLRDHDTTQSVTRLPLVVIAGGYDIQCAENVEYLSELQQLAQQLSVPVDFRKSISDTERAALLQQATAVLYTPENEHFGIVPIEAMYAQTIVVANQSGGPVETILDSVTGFLCEKPTPEEWGRTLQKVLQLPPQILQSMGQAARKRVQDLFSEERLRREWIALIQQTIVCKQERKKSNGFLQPKVLLQVLEFFVIIGVAIVLILSVKLFCMVPNITVDIREL